MTTSIRLRISDASARQDRLTDLMVDGTITKSDFQLRKQNNEFELQCLRDELRQIEERQKSEEDLDAFPRGQCPLLHSLTQTNS